jgi:transposase-like protein
MNIREAYANFATDEQCLQYIEKMRWPDGVVRCLQCGDKNIKRVERRSESKNKRGWFYLCLEKTCHTQFSPTSGTLFHDTHLPLIVWFQAVVLILNAKKGISAKQLQRDLGIGGYKTAWHLNHRIREAMKDGDIPLLGGIVEIDETYVGGKTIRRKDRGNRKPKDAVVGMVERGGRVRFRHVGKGNVKAVIITQLTEKHVSPDVERIMTDESPIYLHGLPRNQLHKHSTINHSREYVRGEIHTNTVESAFSLLKRGIIGNFHKVSIKHLHRYLAEFEYRYNRRNEKDSFAETVRRLAGLPNLSLQKLTSDETAWLSSLL